MKKYIFLDTSIVNVGGGQLYVKTKSEYLKSIGYRVYAFSYVKGDVVIKELLEYKPYIITELEIPPSTYSEKTLYNYGRMLAQYELEEKNYVIYKR